MTNARGPLATVAGLALVVAATLQLAHQRSTAAATDVLPICRVRTSEPIVALSFDDGPDRSRTPLVLELLERDDARATFFVIGERARSESRLIGTIDAAGHELGDHTWSHPHLDDLAAAAAVAEIDRGLAAIPTRMRTTLFRAPYGAIDVGTLHDVRDEGLTTVGWSVPFDRIVATSPSPSSAAREAFSVIAPGDIVLAHDADDGGVSRARAIESLGLLLPMLRDAGYEVVTVSDLLALGEPVRATPRPWFWQSGFECPRA